MAMSYRALLLPVALAAALWLALPQRAAHAMLPEEGDPHLDEGTALILGKTLKIGLLSFDYGLTDRVAIGTIPPGYVIKLSEPVVAPNLHLKVIPIHRGPYWLALQLAFFYLSISDNTTAGSAVVLPLSIYNTYHVNDKVWLHGEVTYNSVFAEGAGNISRVTLHGAGTTRSLQVGLLGEYRIRREISLTLTARVQVYTGVLAFEGDTAPDSSTNADVQARITPRVSNPWNIVPGVAFLWQRVRLTLGVGYGNYFLPGIDIPLQGKSVVPEGNLAVLF